MTPKRRIIPVFVPHMGCPNCCVFCNQRRIAGTESAVTPNDVLNAAAVADRVSPAPAELAFYGGSFTAIPVETQIAFLEAAQPFLSKNPDNSIRVSTRPDCIDTEILARLKRYGVKTVELGAQSLDGEVLRLSKRGHTAADVENAARAVKDAGLLLVLQMMTGLPGDTPKASMDTARRFISLRPDGVRIYPAVIVRDTELFYMWRRGEYREHTVEEAVALCAELLALFEDASVPVIRVGLNPTDDLSAGAAVAGAYHPAFGELCRSRVYLNKAAAALYGTVMPGSGVIIGVARGHTARMIGLNRRNVVELKRRFSLRSVKVVEFDAEPGKISVEIFG